MDIVSIESIAFIADGNYSSKYPRNDEFISEGVPFIRANNFENSTISDKDMLFISKEKHSTIRKGHLKYNDVLITTRGNIGKTALVPKRHENSNINAQIVLLRCKENCYPKYLMHSFSIPFVKNQLDNNTTGTALKQLSVGNLRKIQIPLPPLATQKAIAEKLDKADALRKKDQELLKQYDELAQSIFIEMFGDPVQNEKGWEKVKLEEVCTKIYGGGTPSKSNPNFYIGDIPWVTPKDMKYDFISDSIDHINEEAISKSSAKLIPENSLLMVIRSGILKHTLPLAINIVKVALNQDMKAFIPDEDKTNVIYLKCFFKAIESYLLTKVRAVTADNIEFSEIKSLDFINPPLDLQNQFSEKIKNIEAQKELVKKQAEESENLFKALLQESFNFS